LAKLLLVRHGKTKLHKADRFWGKTDITLSNVGIRQANRLRDRLVKEKIAAVYTSKLSRALLTAQTIVSGQNVAIKSYAELNELNFGYVEGLTFREISRLHPELAEELVNWNPRPSFPGGESLADLNTRVQNFLKLLEKHKLRETVLIVAHAGPLRLIISNLLGIDIAFWRKIHLDLASLSIVETFPQGAILRLLNDISHLKP
jgi:alpha-ribazole phosphatase